MGVILGPAAGLSAIVGHNAARTLDPEIGELLLDPDPEGFGHIHRMRLRRDDHPEFGFEIKGLEAGTTGLEVGHDLGSVRLVEFLIEECVDLGQRPFAVRCPGNWRDGSGVVVVGHGGFQGASGTASVSPRSMAKSCNCIWSAFLPRCSRLITVPIGISRSSAISL